MANLHDCIDRGISSGLLKEQTGLDLQHKIEGFTRELTLNGKMDIKQARPLAEKRALQAKAQEVALRKRQTALQAVVMNRAVNDAKNHSGTFGDGVMALLVKDMGEGAGYSNIDNRAKAILGTFHAEFAPVMDSYRLKMMGLKQDQQGLRDMVRELFGQGTTNTLAKKHADTWTQVAETARVRFNQAGGDIKKLEGWGLPQFHDSLRVKGTSKLKWKDEIQPLLNRQKMLNSSGQPMNDLEMELMLDKAYDTITTNGLSDMVPGASGGSKLANTRQDHRVLMFKDGDAWLKYHDKYGHNDIYTTLTDHLNSMSQDIAKLEVLGPNPEAAFRTLRDMAKINGTTGNDLRTLESTWNTVSGKINQAESIVMADFMKASRSLIVSAKLGGAFLSAISDLAFQRLTSKFNGLSSNKVIARQMALFNPQNADDRLMAVKMQLTADAWATRALAANRESEVTGSGFSAKAADFVMKASFLSSWTDAGRKAFGMEFHSFISDQVARSFNDLPPALQKGFKRYGIDSNDWEIMRTTEAIDYKGAKYFSAENIMSRSDLSERQKIDLSTKVQEMVLTETDYAVPTPDARVRAITTMGQRSGTIMGEISRSAFMFKSFPITVMTTHLMRGIKQKGWRGKGSYLGSLVVSTTIMGGLSLQAKEIAKGRDPMDTSTPEFFGAAFLQGGGAGIFGDFLFSDANRFGQGPITSLLGPVAGLADSFTTLTIGNMQQAIKGEDMNLGSEAIRFAQQNLPAGSLWYTRLAFERMVINEMQQMADPKARKKFKKQMKTRKKDYDQDYWWDKGKSTPDRAPNLDKAISF